LISGDATFRIFLFLVYYRQETLGHSAITSGLDMLPVVLLSGTMANVGNTKLMPRLGPKPMVIAGMLLNAAGMVWLTRSARIRATRQRCSGRSWLPVPASASSSAWWPSVFSWCAGIFAAGAVIWGALLRRGPLTRPGGIPRSFVLDDIRVPTSAMSP
jgi:hypothetical protein